MTEQGKLLELSRNMLAACISKAKEINVPMVISVVDKHGNLVLHARMEDALLASINIALNKAYTAVAAKCTTADLADVSKEGGSLFGLITCDNGRMVVFGGGFPIYENGEIIAGIGVSGGTPDEDSSVAKAGLALLVQ